ncbi:photosynthetic complex assembly protein PuhC [Parasulfitobacter algicola]|uniref:Pullulanase n=1 Tax=Parasulfitobacter algicola TaxID=2614809 RepID=A0ABX2ISW6_9RHOB|nr:photosynthetic complex assembly protein PuhC [Sulfitobacter algicola]NSX53454.1 pullulanase [Sulfitobacter algicola]
MELTPEQKLVERDKEMIPIALVRAMFGLAAVCLIIVIFARVTDRPLEAIPDMANVAQERVIVLQGEMSGAATVLDAQGNIIADLDPTQGGFVAGVYRVLERERTKHRIALDSPVRLVRFENGRLMIFDDTTKWRADLMGFGADNHAAFAKLLDQ